MFSRVHFRLTIELMHFIVHQIVLLPHDWSKRVTKPNIPQLKQGDIRSYYSSDIPQCLNLTFNRTKSLRESILLLVQKKGHFR